MKTTKRSKMLLSSIAMLLVALVALGSATFAWYSIQRTVTADTINVKASTPGGLEISLDDTTYTDSVDLVDMGSASTPIVLQPAKLTFDGSGTNGISAVEFWDGTSDSDGSAKTGTQGTATVAAAKGTYYVVDEIWVRSTSPKAGNVQAYVTAGGTTTDSFQHLALVEASGSKLGEQDASAGTTKTAMGSAVPYAAAVGGVATTTKHYYVIAYAAGEDTDCKTSNTHKTDTIDWTINFELTDAASA